jgi:hypothetical protein
VAGDIIMNTNKHKSKIVDKHKSKIVDKTGDAHFDGVRKNPAEIFSGER